MKHACACWCVNVNIYFYTFRLPYLNVKIVAIFVAKLGNVFIESLWFGIANRETNLIGKETGPSIVRRGNLCGHSSADSCKLLVVRVHFS